MTSAACIEDVFWTDGTLQVYVTYEILQEYYRVLTHFCKKMGSKDLAEFQSFISENVLIRESEHIYNECRDPDDNKFVECALSVGASFIISGDKELLELKEVEEIKIVNPGTFLKNVQVES
jgi:uncharacterized protein